MKIDYEFKQGNFVNCTGLREEELRQFLLHCLLMMVIRT